MIKREIRYVGVADRAERGPYRGRGGAVPTGGVVARFLPGMVVGAAHPALSLLRSSLRSGDARADRNNVHAGMFKIGG